MLTKEIKKKYVEEIKSFVSTDFTAIDVVHFIIEHESFASLLKNLSFIDYSNELMFLEEHDDSEIKCVLNTPHYEFYDPEYGSQDPLCGFRLSKQELNIEDFEEIYTEDNILSHLLYAIEEETEEIPLENVLSKETLSRLLEDADCKAEQIYYFEPLSKSKFYFAHYFRGKDNSWDAWDGEYDLLDTKQIYNTFFTDLTDHNRFEPHFFNQFEYSYLEYVKLSQIDFFTLKDVYNGKAAIEQIKDFATIQIRFLKIDILEMLYIEKMSNNRILH